MKVGNLLFYFDFLFFLICLIALIIGVYTDFKERIVPNNLTYSVIILAILLNFAKSIYFNDYSYALYSIISGIGFFIFFYIMYTFGVFAGGDVKLFTAIAFLLPFNTAFLNHLLNLQIPLLQTINLPIFSFTLFFYSIFCVMPLTLGLQAFQLYKNKSLLKEFKEKSIKLVSKAIALSLSVFALNLLFLRLTDNLLLVYVLTLIALIAIAFIQNKIKNANYMIGLISLIAIIYLDVNVLSNALQLMILFILFSILLELYFMRKKLLRKVIKINELKDGDVLAESYYLVNNKLIKAKEVSFMEKVKLISKNGFMALNDLKPKGKLIASNLDAGGVDEKQARRFKQLALKSKIKLIGVRLTMPFIPAIFIAFILSSLLADFVWVFLFFR